MTQKIPQFLINVPEIQILCTIKRKKILYYLFTALDRHGYFFDDIFLRRIHTTFYFFQVQYNRSFFILL